jgi:hypothetical protein
MVQSYVFFLFRPIFLAFFKRFCGYLCYVAVESGFLLPKRSRFFVKTQWFLKKKRLLFGKRRRGV